MKRKVFRWLLGALAGGLILFILAFLAVDLIARMIAERRIRAQTGMETTIGKFTVGFSSATIEIEDLILKNPHEFGGGIFVDMPELFLEYDRDALRQGKLRLKTVRINIAQIHVVENRNGERNVDNLHGNPRKSKSGDSSGERPTTGKKELPLKFDGIDTLHVTLRVTKFTSARNPKENMESDLGIRNETFSHLKTQSDFQTVAAVLAIKAGASFLLNGGKIRDSVRVLKQGSKAGIESKNILEELTVPIPEKPTTTSITNK